MINSNLKQYLDKHASPEIKEILTGAFSSRGARKGFLLSAAPSSNKKPLANLAWNAIMLQLAPVQFQAFSMMFLPVDKKATFNAVEGWAALHSIALNCLAQKPFQFNLWHHRYDAEKATKILLNLPTSLK